ncbi:bifunctional diaminohydroxyphosphoribosylaminopyrimidine deaminase/5-amino-6-(5-phosphoribosylamino)uracil reductase RibD [Chloroflexota bacterium]
MPVDYMAQALSLARLALGYTSPNPAVGAVVVKGGAVVGLGYTQPPGSRHAEIVALQQAEERARGGSLFVTLEPCNYFGRTPSCVQAIIAAGIAEVHFSMLDPNPLVSGEGRAELERGGIKTYVGEREEEARELNEAYIKYITTGIPFVTAKIAMSLDGKVATRSGDSKWISGDKVRQYSRNLRYSVDAIMVGVNTVLVDDPHLTARSFSDRGGKSRKQPLRVILDGKGRTPLTAQVFKEPGDTLLAVASSCAQEKEAAFVEGGAGVVFLPSKRGLVDLEALLKNLRQREITSVLVEGGGTLLGSFFDHKLVDKVVAFIAPVIIGGKEARSAVEGGGVEKVSEAFRLERVRIDSVEDNLLLQGYIRK